MTDDDRQDTRRGDAQGEDELGAFLDGLLGGLPENGRGSGGEAPVNPFRDPSPGGRPRQGPEPSPPTDAPPPAGPPVSTDADPDPLGLASPTGPLAPTRQSRGAGATEAGDVRDGPGAPIPDRDGEREDQEADGGRSVPGTPGDRAGNEAPGGHSIPNTVAGEEGSRALDVGGAHEVQAAQAGEAEPAPPEAHGAATGPVPSGLAPGPADGHVSGGPDPDRDEAHETQGADGNEERAGSADPREEPDPHTEREAPAPAVAPGPAPEPGTPAVPGDPSAPVARPVPAAQEGGRVPGAHTGPEPSGVPQDVAVVSPEARTRDTYGSPVPPGTSDASAGAGTGGVGGTGGHAVPVVAGGHASGADNNTEPYGVRGTAAPGASGETGSDAPAGADPDPGPGGGEEPGRGDEHPPSAGEPAVAGGPTGELTPSTGTRGTSEVRAEPAPGDGAAPGASGADARPEHAEQLPEDTQAPAGDGPAPEGPHAPGNGDPTPEGPRAATGPPAGAARGNVPPEPAESADHASADELPGSAAAQQDQAPDGAERSADDRATDERHEAHSGFRPDAVPDDLLTRVLEAAHRAPSAGDTKPWDFLVIDDRALRTRVHDLALDERAEYARSHPGTRAQPFSGLGAGAVLEAPLNIAVTVDPTRGPHHTDTGGTDPTSTHRSAVLAVENLWLAARAEGLGVGWVSFLDERDVARALDLPPHLGVVAYLCLGHVDEFPTGPELGLGGWVKERPLSWAVHHDRYGCRGLPGQEPTSLLEETITAITGGSARAMEEARDRQRRMVKPQGALGVLEEVSVRLAGLSGECPPPIPAPAAVAIFAGDHGVHAQGVTPWPQEITAQMVDTFLAGGAVVNTFAAQVGADVSVVDVGVAADLPSASGLLSRKVARGTADATQGPAMTRPQALQALETGIEVARDLVSSGHRCLVTGDMGIANTTPSAALICAYTGATPDDATGKGAGVDEATRTHKVDVVQRMLAANPVDPADPVGTLAALGGLEHAALAGFVLGGAAMRVPVLLDGVIAGSAALAAVALSPESAAACFAGHRSSEPGHSLALEHLGLPPLIDLGMRVGEGSGAVLALPLLQASARALESVATFEDSGVTSLS
ncbi:nicotinate-nucleotide--dimethylbenzimidazole phosphoribosyltransferase [Nocardiopsis kunsanensis]|uniref:nicotinate-nucleotide--dimethylbenzimidazole phosphoribosyltransferase n=1 Tax=Nocardiopsis kunsanensis TaxID=141693 RepID=UPI00034CA35B|nr:nicotinate-nucleotide--dimethylbenzimidazole phosphoribosyltransferase [Nocardiopsis kunsanensis]